MLERLSALASARPYKSSVLTIAERPGFTLTQVAGLTADFDDRLAGLIGKLPARVGVAHDYDGRSILRVGPVHFWIIGPETDDTAAHLSDIGAVTSLSHSRPRICIEGAPARDVLAKLMPLDFHPSGFTPGNFALTGMHHTPVTVHCTSRNSFDIYVLRTFALNLWEVITDAALEHC
jgi:methylglutamate dehydrogenase subunit D